MILNRVVNILLQENWLHECAYYTEYMKEPALNATVRCNCKVRLGNTDMLLLYVVPEVN